MIRSGMEGSGCVVTSTWFPSTTVWTHTSSPLTPPTEEAGPVLMPARRGDIPAGDPATEEPPAAAAAPGLILKGLLLGADAKCAAEDDLKRLGGKPSGRPILAEEKAMG